jgi:hypothetical protein
VHYYRSSLLTDFVGVVLAPLIMVATGLEIALNPGGAGDPGTAPGYVVSGVIVGAAGVFLAASQARSRIVLSEHGVRWCFPLRTRSAAWENIHEIKIVGAASMGSWYSPALLTDTGSVRINSVIGSRRYVEKIAASLEDARPRTADHPGGRLLLGGFGSIPIGGSRSQALSGRFSQDHRND